MRTSQSVVGAGAVRGASCARGAVAAVAVALTGIVPQAGAQVFFNPGDAVIFDTLGTADLVTRAIDLQSGSAAGLPDVFRFEFGFATRESSGAGLHDSLTVTLTTTSDTPVAVLGTMDVFGLTLAPATTGGLAVSVGDLTLSAVAPPAGFGTGMTAVGTYAVDYLIPQELRGQPLRAYFDLADNGDALDSAGFARVPVPAPVPEPESWAMGVSVLLVGWAGWRRWRVGVSRR